MFQNKKIDLLSLHVPLYQIAFSKVPIAEIMTPGRQIIYRKMPKNKEYFIDKELGLFQIKPECAFFVNKTAVYKYDMRNQNPIDPYILNELYQWANKQGLYKIRRADVNQAKLLRAGRTVDELREEKKREKVKVRAFMNSVLDKVKTHNEQKELQKKQEAGLEENAEEYKKISPTDANFLIVQNLFDNGYIEAEQAAILNHKLTKNVITNTDQLLAEIDSFTTVYVTQPITNEMERILDDYHTYRPADVLSIISKISKVRRGLGNLRTKPLINWFPATYLLFGGLAIGIVILLWFTYGQNANVGDIIPKK